MIVIKRILFICFLFQHNADAKLIICLGTPFTTISLGMTDQFFYRYCDRGAEARSQWSKCNRQSQADIQSESKRDFMTHINGCEQCRKASQEELVGRDPFEFQVLGYIASKLSFLNLHFTLDYQIDKFIHGPSMQFTYSLVQYGLLTVGYSCGYLVEKSKSYHLFIKGGINYVRMMPHSDWFKKKCCEAAKEEAEEEAQDTCTSRIRVGLQDQNWAKLQLVAQVTGQAEEEIGGYTLLKVVSADTPGAESYELPSGSYALTSNSDWGNKFDLVYRDGKLYYTTKIDKAGGVRVEQYQAKPTNGINPYFALVWHNAKGDGPSHMLEFGVIIWDNAWKSDRDARKHSFRCVAKWNWLIRYNLLWRLM